MPAGDQKVDRVSFTRRFLDKRRNPWEYIDEELPTTTVKIFSRKKQGTILDSSSGLTIMGSIYFSGSHYEFDPGTYSLRVIRRSVYVGSIMPTRNTNHEWKLRHSREGTVDMIPFFIGTQVANSNRNRVEPSEARGGPMNPLYTFGPGTIWAYWNPRSGTARVYSSLEGILS